MKRLLKNIREHTFMAATITLLSIAFLVFFFMRNDRTDFKTSLSAEAAPFVVLPEGSYAAFLRDHDRVPPGSEPVEIDILSPSEGFNFSTLAHFEGEAAVLRMEEDSYIEFKVDIAASGLYNINMEYFPVPARGIDIVRELRINGAVPFTGAEQLIFSRIWGDSPIGVRKDNRGNQIRPPQVERPGWQNTRFRDRLGYFTDPFQFYFEAGENSLVLIGVSEPLVIRRLTLIPVTELPSYDAFIRSASLNAVQSEFLLKIQGEDSNFRSSPSLFPRYDSSSGITDPPSASLITLNMIGGEAWRVPGQWIEWDIDIPADGLYRISLSARQNYNRGFVSNRSLYINGGIPFREAAAIPFRFNNDWELITLSGENGSGLLFPMKAGTNTLRLEVTLGEMGPLIDRLINSVNRLNGIYRAIMVVTGPEPDRLRDYRIHAHLPHVMDMIYTEIDVLKYIARDLTNLTGERNEHVGMIHSLATQLELFHARPDRIPIRLVNFRQNISALADAARILTEGQLDIDFLIISGTSANLPKVKETFLGKAAHEASAFFASFFMDFDSLGDVYEGNDAIDVWITTGRDQATILKSMIDDTFVPNSGTGVNLRLVAPQAVLPAIVAGIGPDAVLSLPQNNPIDFAIRNASADLTKFPDFSEAAARFPKSAMASFEFQGGYYALPETQNFSLMFYRKDIFEELGLSVPETWDDVLAIMPILQRNNMQVGIPPVGDPMNPDISGLQAQIYQRGGRLYNETNSRSILDTEEAIAGFDAFTRFFTHYGSPVFYNFLNKFRSGEMPIGFTDFTTFNTLAVFAPEIQGAWDFAVMPGIKRADGIVDHSVPVWGTAAVLFSAGANKDKAWDFLKWWTAADTQLRFGREMESLMGAAARHPTANLEAFERLPWSSAQLDVLNSQRKWTVGTPEVPGGYYVQRSLIFAARRVIGENVDTRETMLDFVITINRELINKRKEFGLE